ncbi:MAG: GNAT family N-acetyltransferase [Actinobacteria bacterium]|jgi:ribosomal protein S18 acetylase RimI-like enzyme|nr:GNAT family N-acetyltransferase [Actinomycetota bacterium]MDP7550571.1 GNAT family N-acetyltransferase [Acidimicrobiales bacterium]MBT3688150.1 GNAT family N-acetyltransferase [Actinomycetota bacterium]MBT4036458.1 GNAT family N-acetyltransferase [Actinomycetota bacterium]MBT4278421.1 GNAT family N-acetyltransferase [Actinomycetota bacterium]|tara:strand:+ start:6268 stop:6894 length:627 start_codon:yes stop_codon:yes gene_type:complete
MPDITYTPIEARWAAELAAIERAAFPTVGAVDLLTTEDIETLCGVFPDGGFVAFDGDKPVAMGVGILIDFNFDEPHHSLDDLCGENSCGNHRDDADWYYGVTIAVDPQYRRLGIGQQLYVLRKETVRRLGKKGIVAGGVIPGYADHINEMSAADYVERVVAGELYDPTLSFQLANGFEARGAIPNYLDDPAVGDNAVLIVWNNPDLAS